MHELNSPTLSIKLICQTMPRMTCVQRIPNCPPTSILWRHRHLHGKEGRHVAYWVYWTLGLCQKKVPTSWQWKQWKSGKGISAASLVFSCASHRCCMDVHPLLIEIWLETCSIYDDPSRSSTWSSFRNHRLDCVATHAPKQQRSLFSSCCTPQTKHVPWLTLHLSLNQCLRMPWISKTKWSEEKGVD